MKRTLFGAGAAILMLVNSSGSVQAEVWPGFFRDATAPAAPKTWPGFYRSDGSATVRATLRSAKDEQEGHGNFMAGLFPRPKTRSDQASAPQNRTETVEMASLQSSVEVSSALASDRGGSRGHLRLAAGYYDFIATDDEAASFSAEYHMGRRFWWFDPFAGVMLTTEGAAYAYAGLALDIVIANRVAITPSAAVGAYHEGGGKDLGHWVEFRTGGELAYIFDNQQRLGLAFHHISNAGLGNRNPGVEILELTYSAPLGALFSK